MRYKENINIWFSSRLFFLSIFIFLLACQSTIIQDTGDLIKVPNASAVPVLIDGLFSENEWNDAREIQMSDNYTLYLKKKQGHVFLGIKIIPFYSQIIELYISPDKERIYHFHASAQIGEILIKSDSDWENQQFRWGNSNGWYANEIRWDQYKRDSLQNVKVADNEAFMQSMYKFEGFEFQILKSKFKTNKWRIMLEIPGPPDYENPFTYPTGSEKRNTDTWMELILD
ncbi:hypothetical protein ACFLTI_03295 [Bacteroidota bacterium]